LVKHFVVVKNAKGRPSFQIRLLPFEVVSEFRVVWQGDVEVFDLHGQPKARRANCLEPLERRKR
jgi:hypothetical protein